MRNQVQQFLIILITIQVFSIQNRIYGQNAGIQFNSAQSTPSYTLIGSAGITYLVDNCGDVVHSWAKPETSWHPKVLPNGNLMYLGWNDNTIYERNWEGDIEVELTIPYDEENSYLRLEYELIKLENGNYLCVGKTGGANVVVEIDKNTGAFVWEWNIMDHVIQESNPNEDHYGSLKDNPQLLNLDAISRYDSPGEQFMINGMDYHPELDQILLSTRKISEIIIIDHSTTTEEASGHTGGNSGKGGDVLFRWGNPQNYDQGTEEDRFLYFQHNPNWIKEGPRRGQIICYNNGLNRPNIDELDDRYSDIPIIIPPINDNGTYDYRIGEPFLPSAPDIVFSGQDPESKFYSGYLSGAKAFPSGNVFITEGQGGRIFEINTDGQKVWEYQIPFDVFRVEKYAITYPAFEGRDLMPQGKIPEHINDYDCQLVVNAEEQPVTTNEFELLRIDDHHINLIHTNGETFNYLLFDPQGRITKSGASEMDHITLSIDHLSSGIYFLQAIDQAKGLRETFKILVK